VLAVGPLYGVPKIVDCPVLERLRQDPDDVGTKPTFAITKSEGQGVVSGGAVPPEVSVAAELDLEVRISLASDSTQRLLAAFCWFGVGVSLQDELMWCLGAGGGGTHC